MHQQPEADRAWPSPTTSRPSAASCRDTSVTAPAATATRPRRQPCLRRSRCRATIRTRTRWTAARDGAGWPCCLPYAEQAPLYNAINVNLPTWVADNGTVVLIQINVFLCPSANNPTPTCPMVDANLNLLPVANQYFARANYQYNMGWNDTSMTPPTVNYDDPVLGDNGPLYRNSHVPYAGVTDGLSNTVFASEKTPYLADASPG